MSVIHERFGQWRLEKRKTVSIIKKSKQSEKLRQWIKDLYEEFNFLDSSFFNYRKLIFSTKALIFLIFHVYKFLWLLGYINIIHVMVWRTKEWSHNKLPLLTLPPIKPKWKEQCCIKPPCLIILDGDKQRCKFTSAQ